MYYPTDHQLVMLQKLGPRPQQQSLPHSASFSDGIFNPLYGDVPAGPGAVPPSGTRASELQHAQAVPLVPQDAVKGVRSKHQASGEAHCQSSAWPRGHCSRVCVPCTCLALRRQVQRAAPRQQPFHPAKAAGSEQRREPAGAPASHPRSTKPTCLPQPQLSPTPLRPQPLSTFP